MAEKVIFDGAARTVTVKDGVYEINVMEDLYMASVDWLREEADAQWLPPFESGGREPTNASRTQFTPSYIFILNGWTIVCGTGESISFATNLYPDPDGSTTAASMFTILNNTVVSNRQSDSPVVASELENALAYGGLIHIDTTVTETGSSYPYGTTAKPVNNAMDAQLISDLYGIHKFYLKGRLIVPYGTFDDFEIQGGAGAEVVGYEAASFINGIITNCHIEGAIGAGSSALTFIYCHLEDGIEGIQGHYYNCGFEGDFTIAENADPLFIDCYSMIGGAESPNLIMPANALSENIISMRGYKGGLVVSGFQGDTGVDENGDLDLLNPATQKITIEFQAGKCTIDNTNTGGYISVRGIPFSAFVDNSLGTFVDTASLLASQKTLDEMQAGLDEALQNIAYGGMVSYDTDHGYAGTEYPIGTHTHPVNNFADAKLIMEARTIEKLHIHNNIVINQDFPDVVIEGKSGKEVVILQNVNIDGVYFKNLYLAGQVSGGSFRAEQCAITNGFVGINGAFTRCGVVGDFTVIGETPTLFENCFALAYDGTTPIVYMGAVDDLTPYYVNFRGFFGKIIVANMSGPDQTITLGFNGGGLIIDSSNTDGTIAINGLTKEAITDNSDGSEIIYGNTPASSTEVQQVAALISMLI
jgi:hypothetical protein